MDDFFLFVRTQFKQTNNGLMQVILLNIWSFITLLLLKALLTLLGYEATYMHLVHAIALPSTWAACVQQPWALLTYGWIHTSLYSTLWGLFILYSLGKVVADLVGNRHFLSIYLLGGLAGGGTYLLLYHISPHLHGTRVLLMGLSGNLYAIVAAAATLAPELKFYLLFFGPVKLKHIVSFLLLFALVELASPAPASSIAQLGGALLGYLYIKQLYGHTYLRQYWRQRRKSVMNISVHNVKNK